MPAARHLQLPHLPDRQDENEKVGDDIRNGKAQEKSGSINAGRILNFFGCCPLDGRMDAAFEDGHEEEDDGPEADDSDDDAVDAPEALDPEDAAIEEQDAQLHKAICNLLDDVLRIDGLSSVSSVNVFDSSVNTLRHIHVE
ncbi:MAG: hypothetical protein Q9165_002724 [Trypethelium subeluteriae]